MSGEKRGRPRRDPSAEPVAAPQKRKAKKEAQPALEPPDDIQCIFRTLQAVDMESFAQVYEILRHHEGRGGSLPC